MRYDEVWCYDEDLTDHDLEMIWFTGDLYGPCFRCWCRIRFSHSPAMLAMGLLWPAALVAWVETAGRCQTVPVPSGPKVTFVTSHGQWPLTLGPWGTPSLTSHSDPEYSRMQLTRVSHLVSSGLKPASQPHGTPCCPWHPASPGSTSTPRPSSSQISWSP